MKHVPPSVSAALRRRGRDDILQQDGEYEQYKSQIDQIIHGDDALQSESEDYENDIESQEPKMTPEEEKANKVIEGYGEKYDEADKIAKQLEGPIGYEDDYESDIGGEDINYKSTTDLAEQARTEAFPNPKKRKLADIAYMTDVENMTKDQFVEHLKKLAPEIDDEVIKEFVREHADELGFGSDIVKDYDPNIAEDLEEDEWMSDETEEEDRLFEEASDYAYEYDYTGNESLDDVVDIVKNYSPNITDSQAKQIAQSIWNSGKVDGINKNNLDDSKEVNYNDSVIPMSSEDFLNWHEDKSGKIDDDVLHKIYRMFEENGSTPDDDVDVAYNRLPESKKAEITELIKNSRILGAFNNYDNNGKATSGVIDDEEDSDNGVPTIGRLRQTLRDIPHFNEMSNEEIQKIIDAIKGK